MSSDTAYYTCSVHNHCVHSVPTCNCSICWPYFAQCRYNEYNESRMEMDRPETDKRRMSELCEQKWSDNLRTTEEIRCSDEIEATRLPTDRERWNERPFDPDRGESTQLCDSTGASQRTGFLFPDIGSARWCSYIFESYKHQQPTDSDETIRTRLRSHIRQLLSDNSVDTVVKHKLRGALLQYTYDGDSDTSDHIKSPTGDATHVDGQCISSVAIHVSNNCINSSNGNAGTTTTSSNASGNTTEPRDSKAEKLENNQQNKQINPKTTTPTKHTVKTTTAADTRDGIKRRGNPVTDNGGNTARPRETTYYTFILHKHNIHESAKTITAQRNRQPPHFAKFDHGDHFHILYTGGTHSGNISRQRNRICEFLCTTHGGLAEALSSAVRVKNIQRFLLYCLRKGLSKFDIVGADNQETLSNLQKQLHTLLNTEDPNAIIEECSIYMEDKRENREETTKRIGKIKGNNVVDMIQHYIKEYNINTQTEWDLRIPSTIKETLIREFGLTAESYINKLIKYKKLDRTQAKKNKTLTEHMLEELNNSNEDFFSYDFIKKVKWIRYLFDENKINIIEFLAWNEIIKTKRYIKINGLVLLGKTNAGKSLIIDTLLKPIEAEEIPRERDNNGFHLDQLPCATAALFEEPIITPINVGTWKLLLEGKEIKTDIKHKEKEGIRRLPIYITTATAITVNVDANEASQINQRIKQFKFRKSIRHRSDPDAFVEAELIDASPGIIETVHFAFIFITHWKEIREKIETLDIEHKLASGYLQSFTAETCQQLREKTEELKTLNPKKQTIFEEKKHHLQIPTSCPKIVKISG